MKQEEIKNIFNEIASYYDRVNNFISLGTHKKIKRDVVKLLEIPSNAQIADLCTGTGDFVQIISKIHPSTNIIGIDNSEEMLKFAKIKNPNNVFIQADCTELPLKNSTLDFVFMSFGLRNIVNSEKALKEIHRILKNNGKFIHLDFGKHNILNKIFNILVPTFATIFGYDKDSYEYLIKSKNNFPEPEELIKIFEQIGFKLFKRKDYLFGAISVQIMQKCE